MMQLIPCQKEGSKHRKSCLLSIGSSQQPEPERTPPEGSLKWRVQFPVGENMSSDPAVADGKVYITLNDNSLHALHASTGDIEWTFMGEGWITSSPVVVNGVVYAGSWDQKVYALDASSGELLWRYTTDDNVSNPLIVEDGTVYVGSGNQAYALEAVSGKLLWSSEVDVHVSSSPVLVEGTLYVGSLGGHLYALDTATGDVLWQYKVSDESYSVSTSGGKVYSEVFTEPSIMGGRVYIGSDSGYLYSLDALSGEVLWQYKTSSEEAFRRVATHGRVVLAAEAVGGHIYALDASSGQLLWEYRTGQLLNSLAVKDGILLAGGTLGFIFALDALTGEPLWRAEGRVLDPVQNEGVIYVENSPLRSEGTNNEILAFDAQTGETLWIYRSDVRLGLKSTGHDGVLYVTPSENYHDPEDGYTGRYLYALTSP